MQNLIYNIEEQINRKQTYFETVMAAEENKLNQNQLISLIMHNSLYEFKQKHSNSRNNIVADNDKKGAIGLVKTKQDLAAVYGIIATSKEAVFDLNKNHEYWTPNTYNYLTYQDKHRTKLMCHEEKNLQQINTFVVDIDTQLNTIEEIIMVCHDYSIGFPTAILRTVKGYQVYFVLDTPIFISNKNNYRSILVAKRISENIRQSLNNELVGVDVTCNHFGFFRMPNQINLVYFNPNNLYDAKPLIEWSMKQADDIGFSLYGRPVKDNNNYQVLLKKILNYKAVDGQRNNTLFTIALAFYATGAEEEEAKKLCLIANQLFEPPLSRSEVKRIVSSAYCGRYAAPKASYIKDLFDLDEELLIRKTRVFNKNSKPRDERQYSHKQEWEYDLLTWLNVNNDLLDQSGMLEASQRDLAASTGIPLATLKKILKSSKQLVVRVIGQGRYAKTYIGTKTNVVAAKISKKKAENEEKAHSLLTTLKLQLRATQGYLTTNNATFDDVYYYDHRWRERSG